MCISGKNEFYEDFIANKQLIYLLSFALAITILFSFYDHGKRCFQDKKQELQESIQVSHNSLNRKLLSHKPLYKKLLENYTLDDAARDLPTEH